MGGVMGGEEGHTTRTGRGDSGIATPIHHSGSHLALAIEVKTQIGDDRQKRAARARELAAEPPSFDQLALQTDLLMDVSHQVFCVFKGGDREEASEACGGLRWAKNLAIVVADSLARVIAAIRITSVRWRSNLLLKTQNLVLVDPAFVALRFVSRDGRSLV